MKVHVTGGSGFLGASVLPQLVERGHRVTALARSAEAANRVKALGAEPIPGDLDDPAQIDAAFATGGAEMLVNLASLGFGHASAIVAAAAEAGLKRAIFVSTTAIFTKLAARSKAIRTAAEEEIRRSALEWTIVRPTMVYGRPGDRNMERLLQLLRRSPIVPLPGGGRRLQQPVHVDDLAWAIANALDRPNTIGQAYDLAGPEPLMLRRLVQEAAEAVGRHPKLLPMPLAPTVVAVRIYERVSPRPRLGAEQLERLAENKAFDISAARRDLDFDPRPFTDGVREEARLL